MSESFPYFSIARDLGVPYYEVLALADLIERIGPFDPVCVDGRARELYCHVENAVVLEHQRRGSVRAS
jgi:hypothetical protein